MLCEQCNSRNVAVIDTRQSGIIRYRRYKCYDCGTRFNTLESYKSIALFKDGSRITTEHLNMVAKQLKEGAAELVALAKLFQSKGD